MAHWNRTITLPLAATNYTLLELMQTVQPLAPKNIAELTLTSDDGNGAALLFIGADSNLSATDFGKKLVAGEGFTDGAGNVMNSISCAGLYLRTDTNASKVNVVARVI